MSAETEKLQERIIAIGKQIEKRDGKGMLPVIDNPSPKWDAWREWRKRHGLPVSVQDRLSRITVISEWPPADLDQFEAEIGKSGLAGKLKARMAAE